MVNIVFSEEEEKLEFNVGDGGRAYKSFIERVRRQLGSLEGAGGSHNRPVLPPQQNPPTDWFDIVLRTNENAITVRFRVGNLYLDAFYRETGDGTTGGWLEYTPEGNNQRLFDGSVFLGFGRNYAEMVRVGQQGIQNTSVGRLAFQTAVNDLAASNDVLNVRERAWDLARAEARARAEAGRVLSASERAQLQRRLEAQAGLPQTVNAVRARALMVVILMISESIRFPEITDLIFLNYRSDMQFTARLEILMTNWIRLSDTLQRADASPHLDRFPLRSFNDTGTTRFFSDQLQMTTVEDVTNALGILVFCQYRGTRAEPRRRDDELR